MASTFAAPSASAASIALTAESTPPDKPTTTRSTPTLRTSLAMNAVRIRRISGGFVGISGRLTRLPGGATVSAVAFIGEAPLQSTHPFERARTHFLWLRRRLPAARVSQSGTRPVMAAALQRPQGRHATRLAWREPESSLGLPAAD